ncbi:peptidoglycan-binding domain-containing protein [Longispora urticae]
MLPFPLGAGHYYGPHPKSDLQCHDGRDDVREWLMLMEWKRTYSRLHEPLPLNGQYDGPTQRAIMGLQDKHNIPATGYLTKETWDALWMVDDPGEIVPALVEEPEPEPVVVSEPPPTPVKRGRGRPKKAPQPV